MSRYNVIRDIDKPHEYCSKTFGLITYYLNKHGEILYHIAQRRDTLAYIHFLRGNVQDDKVVEYFARMTAQEKNRIMRMTFDELWYDMCLQRHPSPNYFYARNRFERQRKSGIIQSAYENTVDKNIELSWTLPKGRKKHYQEPDLVCALREYREETRNKCYLEFVDHSPLTCMVGDFRHSQYITYYIAKSKFCPKPSWYTFGATRLSISEETADVKWASLQEAQKYLPPELFSLVQEVDQIIKQGPKYLILQDVIIKYGTITEEIDPPSEEDGWDSDYSGYSTEDEKILSSPIESEVEEDE